MEWKWNYVLWSALVSLMSLVWYLRRKNSYRRSKLPPGPKGWAIIGSILDVKSCPHRDVAALKQEYGPVVWLSLGSIRTMAILSAAAAEELFKNHDLSFADRFHNDTTRSHDYCKSSMALGPYNVYWRTLRRICSTELFSNKRINETASVRQKCVDEMLSWIEKEVEKGACGGIEVKKFVFPAIFNLIGNLTLSRNLMDPHLEIASEFHRGLLGFTECVSSPNISDLFPLLRWFDLQGLRRRMDRHLGKTIEIVSGFVNERVKQRQDKEERTVVQKDFLDMMLDFEGKGKDEPTRLSHHQITIFLIEMFIAGTMSTSTTIEWAMCELLQNIEAMKKIKAELVKVVGVNKSLKDRDIDNLPYLRATIEETLRLHAPTPLLLPRKAIQDTDFMGYSIPKGTQVVVNVWSIGRDEECWEDASCFKPERFLDSSIGYKGQYYKFIPFGAGRRICPGVPQAHRVLPLILGSLLHHFDWNLCDNGNGEAIIDMRETMGMTVKKLEPLKAVPNRMRT